MKSIALRRPASAMAHLAAPSFVLTLQLRFNGQVMLRSSEKPIVAEPIVT